MNKQERTENIPDCPTIEELIAEAVKKAIAAYKESLPNESQIRKIISDATYYDKEMDSMSIDDRHAAQQIDKLIRGENANK